MLYTPEVADDAIPPRNYPPPLSARFLCEQTAGTIFFVIFLRFIESASIVENTFWQWIILALLGYLFVSGVTLRRSVPWHSRYGNVFELCKLVLLFVAIPFMLDLWADFVPRYISGMKTTYACSYRPSEWIFQAAFVFGLHFSFVDSVDIFQRIGCKIPVVARWKTLTSVELLVTIIGLGAVFCTVAGIVIPLLKHGIFYYVLLLYSGIFIVLTSFSVCIFRGHHFHFHHYFSLGLMPLPLTGLCVPNENILAQILVLGFSLGVLVEGCATWGMDPLFVESVPNEQEEKRQ